MKILKKIIKYSSLTFLVLLLSLMAYACASVPKLSKEDKKIITEVVKAPIPEIVTGKTGFAQSQDHKIWFESIQPKGTKKGTVLLIMGNGNDALTWPPEFISNILNRGYQVIRYDHRGTGLSTSQKKWKKKNAYSLNDMAGDVPAILNELSMEKAHIVGVSMGGMIAQIVAIEFPEKTASLTSIMSSADIFDPELAPMSNEIIPKMIGSVLKHGFFGSKKGQIKRQIIQKRILMGNATGDIDAKTMAQTAIYNLKKRDGYKLLSARHHFQAMSTSTSRLEALSKLNIPILVIHGVNDPVIPIEHSKKLVQSLEKTESLWVENMGHDLPTAAIQEITEKMVATFEQ